MIEINNFLWFYIYELSLWPEYINLLNKSCDGNWNATQSKLLLLFKLNNINNNFKKEKGNTYSKIKTSTRSYCIICNVRKKTQNNFN